MGSIEQIIADVNLNSKGKYFVNFPKERHFKDDIVTIYQLGNQNYEILSDIIFRNPLETPKGYGVFNKEGYIFVPPGITITRKSQKDIGYGILGTANKSAGVIEILDTLYGTDFEEVLMHESIHLENWDASESWVRYETKQRCKFETRFH